MPRTLCMKQHGRVLLTLRSDRSLIDGEVIFRVSHESFDNAAQIITLCRRLDEAYRRDDWCTIDDLMHELQSLRLWLHENGSYVSYNSVGLPCMRQGVIRFRTWLRWDQKGYDFPETRRGHDYAELPTHGNDFLELAGD